MKRSVRTAVWSTGLAGLLVVAVVVSAALGPVRIDPLTVAMAILNGIVAPSGLETGSGTLPVFGWSIPVVGLEYASVFSFDVPGTHQYIVTQMRLPRIALAATVGFALAAAGTVMQGSSGTRSRTPRSSVFRPALQPARSR